MANMIVKILVAGLIASLFVSVFFAATVNVNEAYGQDIATSNISTFQNLDTFSDETTKFRNQTVLGSEVDTQESEAGLFKNAFVVGKRIFSGSAFNTLDDMMRDFVSFVRLPGEFYIALSGVLAILVVFALVRLWVGRG